MKDYTGTRWNFIIASNNNSPNYRNYLHLLPLLSLINSHFECFDESSRKHKPVVTFVICNKGQLL